MNRCLDCGLPTDDNYCWKHTPRFRALKWASKAGATSPEEAERIYKAYREMKDATDDNYCKRCEGK